MEIKLRGKYRVYGSPIGFPAKARTGNSFGPAKSKMPSLVPCKRNPAGPQGFRVDPQPNMRPMVKIVDALTGKGRMVATEALHNSEGKFDAERALAALGLK